jgi:hypothetical protein
MKHVRLVSTVLAVLFLVLVCFPARASALPITFTFSGTVTVVTPISIQVGAPFMVGDAFAGMLTFDSGLVDSNADPTEGVYSPLSALSFTIGSYAGGFEDGSGYVMVRNGPFPTSDSVHIQAGATGGSFGGFTPNNLNFSLTSGNPFGSDALPTAFSSNQFLASSFSLSFTNGFSSTTFVSGTLSGQAGATAVPEPASLLLVVMGIGIVAVSWTAARVLGW